MSAESFQEVPVEGFGGLVSLIDPADLPNGVSPDCRDVEFFPGGLRSRPGLSLPFASISNNPKVNGLKSYITITLTQRLLVFTSDGRLFKESSPGTLTLVASGLVTSAYLSSVTLFAREYMAFSDGIEGLDIPRSFDDTNFDRVTQVGPGKSPTAADSASAGTIVVGAHGIFVYFETRTGHLTKASPPITHTAAGGKKLDLSAVPVGPGNVIRRHIAMTAAGSGKYYHVPGSMTIDDNTTTTLTVDVSDVQITSGESVDYLFRLEVLGNVTGVADYANRLFWWGEENAMQAWNNLSFDGGFSTTLPLGWTAGAANAGGGKESTIVAFGDAYKITGDGATATRGEIKQNALVDAWEALALIEKNTAYTVRARVARSAGLVAGRLNIDIYGTAGVAIDTVGLQVTAAQLGTSYAEFEAELTPAQSSLSTDLVLRVLADQTPTNGESIYLDEIRIFASSEPVKHSIMRASKVNDPEAYDGLTGLMAVRENDGQAIRSAFKLREFFYILKERSLHVTQDDGRNEPSGWTLEQVSEKVGTPSLRGVGLGEGFTLIASRAGPYYFDGGVPQKIGQEIQPTWDSINWAYGHTIWVQVNTEKKQAYFGVPIGASTQPDRILMVDYVEGWEDPLANEGVGRKWCPWFISTNAGGLVERSTGQAKVFFGNNAGNGKVYELNESSTSDDGTAINAYYRTAFLTVEGSSGRNLFGYTTLAVNGAGSLNLSSFLPGDAAGPTMPSLTLSDPALKDLEVLSNILAERVSYKFGTNAAAARFELAKFVAYGKSDPWSPLRGTN